MHIKPLLFAAGIFICAMSAHAGVWQSTEPLMTARGGAGVIVENGRLYAIGGIDGINFINSGEFATIQKDGSLGPWQATTSLNEERGFFGVAVHNGFIYAVGGGNGPNGHNLLRSVERAELLADGKLGPWQRENQELNLPRRCSKVAVVNGYLYAFGGFGGTLLDTVERARIRSDGSLADWEFLEERYTMPRYIHALAKTDDALYAIGGHAEEGGTGIAAVEYAMIKDDNSTAAWQQSEPLQQGRYGLTALVNNDFIYAFGGLSGATFFDAIERSQINQDGSLSPWQTIEPLPAPFADIGVAGYQNWVYVVGGTNREGYYNSVYMAQLDAAGNFVTTFATDAAAAQALAPSKPIMMPNRGFVLQAIDGGAYVYVEVETAEGREWLAAAQSNFSPGDYVHYSPGIFMQNFFSKQLQREFDSIRFVGKLEKIPTP